MTQLSEMPIIPIPANQNVLVMPIHALSDKGTEIALMFWDMVNDAWEARYYNEMIDQAEAYADRLLDIVGLSDERLTFALHCHVFVYYGTLLKKPSYFECQELLTAFITEILKVTEVNND